MNLKKTLCFTALTGLLLSLVFTGIVLPVTASNVTFSDVNLVGTQYAIYVVEENQTVLLGVYNSTDDNVFIPDSASVIIQMKPSNTDFLKNPLLLPDFLNAMLPAWAVYLVILIAVGVVGIIFLKR